MKIGIIVILFVLKMVRLSPLLNSENTFKSYAGYRLIRVHNSGDQEDFKARLKDELKDVDIWGEKNFRDPPMSTYEILISPENEEAFDKMVSSFKTASKEIVIENIQTIVNEERETDKYETDLEGRPIQDVRWNKYYDLEVMYDYLEKLENTFPFRNFVRIEEIGKSSEGRPIKMARIQNFTKDLESSNELPKVFIDGGIHAREWISPAVTLYFIYKLVEEHMEQPELINKAQWLIVPVANPDGYVYSRKSDRMWRKSRNSNKKSDCKGVDLNRNFGYHWGEEKGSQIIKDPCSQVYAGEEPFSEPETKAIRDVILANNKTIKSYFSLHSYSQFWTFPWSYKSPDRNSKEYFNLYVTAEKAVEAVKKRHGTDYIFGSSSELFYISSGTSDDWVYGAAKIKHSFTIELRDTGKRGFLLPARHIIPTAEETFDGIQAIFNDILA